MEPYKESNARLERDPSDGKQEQKPENAETPRPGRLTFSNTFLLSSSTRYSPLDEPRLPCQLLS